MTVEPDMVEPTEVQIDLAARAIHAESDEVLPYDLPGPDPRTTSPRVVRRAERWQAERVARYRRAGAAAAFAVLNPEREARREATRQRATHGPASGAKGDGHGE